MPSRPVRKTGSLPLPDSLRQWCADKPRNNRGKPKYDERLLVELIARDDLRCREIATMTGLSTSMVWCVANGKCRPDLTPLIEEARAKRRQKEEPMNRQLMALAESATASVSKLKTYDDNELVEMIAAGTLPFPAIAQKVGLSLQSVHDVARGKRRPDLQPRIIEATAAYREQARMVGTAHLRTVVTKHIAVGVNTEGETARKCREYVMDNSLAEGKGKPFLCGATAAQRPLRDPDTIRNSECWELMYLIKGDGPPPEPDQASALAALPLETRLKIAAALKIGEVTSTNGTNDGEGTGSAGLLD